MRDDWVVLANLTEERLVQLDLTTRETSPDGEQAEGETSVDLRESIVWSNRLPEISGAEGREGRDWLGVSVLNIVVFTAMSILLFFPVNRNNNNIDNEDWGYWRNG